MSKSYQQVFCLFFLFFVFSTPKCNLEWSSPCSGRPLLIMPNGEVVLFDYDTEEKQVLSNSFEEFIEENFVKW